MVSQSTKAGIQHAAENWIVEFLLPGIFTVILTICLGHLAFYVFQAQAQTQIPMTTAIPAFAN